ncbi:MAG: type II toxin-antitoxin system VapB family antitoxin [Kiritimatiellae bacterium]|nr:type II toxin-antitoxin system VapB family antitoxin [Kiritimatiellia bacterium]
MRLTLNIDGELLDRVVESTGSKTKTDAITYALKEIDRRRRLTEILRRGSGASPDELENMFDPASDPKVLRVAEQQPSYGDIPS